MKKEKAYMNNHGTWFLRFEYISILANWQDKNRT